MKGNVLLNFRCQLDILFNSEKCDFFQQVFKNKVLFTTKGYFGWKIVFHKKRKIYWTMTKMYDFLLGRWQSIRKSINISMYLGKISIKFLFTFSHIPWWSNIFEGCPTSQKVLPQYSTLMKAGKMHFSSDQKIALFCIEIELCALKENDFIQQCEN